MKQPHLVILFLFVFTACSKTETIDSMVTPPTLVPSPTEFTQYRILKGNHFCDNSVLKSINLTAQNFKVRFDSTAVYKTQTEDNQFDINKLFGFSEGLDPHKNSARLGWSYNNDSLRLYGYVYNNFTLATQEVTTCKIGEVINCSIKPEKGSYVFYVNDKSVRLERASLSDTAQGYQLYPYFGGDEVAPHNINIYISSVIGN